MHTEQTHAAVAALSNSYASISATVAGAGCSGNGLGPRIGRCWATGWQPAASATSSPISGTCPTQPTTSHLLPSLSARVGAQGRRGRWCGCGAASWLDAGELTTRPTRLTRRMKSCGLPALGPHTSEAHMPNMPKRWPPARACCGNPVSLNYKDRRYKADTNHYGLSENGQFRPIFPRTWALLGDGRASARVRAPAAHGDRGELLATFLEVDVARSPSGIASPLTVCACRPLESPLLPR